LGLVHTYGHLYHHRDKKFIAFVPDFVFPRRRIAINGGWLHVVKRHHSPDGEFNWSVVAFCACKSHSISLPSRRSHDMYYRLVILRWTFQWWPCIVHSAQIYDAQGQLKGILAGNDTEFLIHLGRIHATFSQLLCNESSSPSQISYRERGPRSQQITHKVQFG
jgi:hypothetical protein